MHIYQIIVLMMIFKKYRLSITLLISILSCVNIHAASDLRYALVIGNSAYNSATPLINPKNDSRDIASTLRELYFETVLLQDATKKQIEQSVKIFIQKLNESEDAVGLFYYAGHGVQLQGENYLVPVETNPGTEQEIKTQSYNVAHLLNGMRKNKSGTNIIVMDACRNNPFGHLAVQGARSVNGKERGLVRVTVPKLNTGLSKLDAPPNTLIAFATAPGRVALDGDGKNSPYTAKLIESLQRTGLTIGEVFRQVREEVLQVSNGSQIPWESSSLVQDFYFKPRAEIPIGF